MHFVNALTGARISFLNELQRFRLINLPILYNSEIYSLLHVLGKVKSAFQIQLADTYKDTMKFTHHIKSVIWERTTNHIFHYLTTILHQTIIQRINTQKMNNQYHQHYNMVGATRGEEDICTTMVRRFAHTKGELENINQLIKANSSKPSKAMDLCTFCFFLNSSHVTVCVLFRLANRAACHSGE